MKTSIQEKEKKKEGRKRDPSVNRIKPHVDAELLEFVDMSARRQVATDFYWTKTRRNADIQKIPENVAGFGNLHRINDIRFINKFLEEANRQLEPRQYLVVCLETKNARKERILNRAPKIVSYPRYVLDFVLNRVFPKWGPTKRIYFAITKSRNRVVSLTEALGRLICCGFEIMEHKRLGYHTYIVAKKVSTPAYDMEPTYGLLVQLKRIGKGGKLANFYKFRTMHPYSEYLQEYLYEKNGTKDGDKIEDDFRVTRWGKVFRMFWIDELPMFLNLLRGDIKLVGVRPLSEHKFYTYPKALQEKRTLVKPGLVPPFYADLPNTPEEFHTAEERYLDSYMEKPIRTDIRYFCKSVYNIVIKGARSR